MCFLWVHLGKKEEVIKMKKLMMTLALAVAAMAMTAAKRGEAA